MFVAFQWKARSDGLNVYLRFGWPDRLEFIVKGYLGFNVQASILLVYMLSTYFFFFLR